MEANINNQSKSLSYNFHTIAANNVYILKWTSLQKRVNLSKKKFYKISLAHSLSSKTFSCLINAPSK
jgi:hypothetical protein